MLPSDGVHWDTPDDEVAYGATAHDAGADQPHALECAAEIGDLERLSALLTDMDTTMVEPDEPIDFELDERNAANDRSHPTYGYVPVIIRAIMTAANNGHDAAVNLLLDALGWEYARRFDEDSLTLQVDLHDLLRQAVMADHTDVAGQVLALGVPVDDPEDDPYDPQVDPLLTYAVQNDNPAMVAELLHAGADPNATDFEGNSPVMLAVWLRKDAALKALLTLKRSHVALSDACLLSALRIALKRSNTTAVTRLVDTIGRTPNTEYMHIPADVRLERTTLRYPDHIGT